MITIWTRTVHVKKTKRTFIFAFSDFIDRDYKHEHQSKVMDDCEIFAIEHDPEEPVSAEHRKCAELLRTGMNFHGFLYGGFRELPSGHRRFQMVDTTDKDAP
jgi:hypothetical protein